MTDNATDSTNRTPRTAVEHTPKPGIQAKRLFSRSNQQPLDPFVLFDEFRLSPSVGFPEHPHAGFEIITYMLDGGLEHSDSTGTSGTITAGDVMRTTTGSGIRHSGFPAGDEESHGLQFWINLPQTLKDSEPESQDAPAETLPVEETAGATVRTVVGTGSPIELQTPIEYLDVTVSSSWAWQPDGDWVGFLYGISGEGIVDENPMAAGEFIITDGGPPLTVTTDSEFRIVAVSGKPHDEPIKLRGSFVE